MRFIHPAVIWPQRKKLSPRMPVMLALTEGRVQVDQRVSLTGNYDDQMN